MHYAYWSDLPADALDVFFRSGFTVLLCPTHDNLTIGALIAPVAEFPRMRLDIDRAFRVAIDVIPEVRGRFAGASRQSNFFGTADQPNFYRRPYGDGWALVGDAGYHKDPCTAQGITDAFHHAGLLATAVHRGLSGNLPLECCLEELSAATASAIAASISIVAASRRSR